MENATTLITLGLMGVVVCTVCVVCLRDTPFHSGRTPLSVAVAGLAVLGLWNAGPTGTDRSQPLVDSLLVPYAALAATMVTVLVFAALAGLWRRAVSRGQSRSNFTPPPEWENRRRSQRETPESESE